jgi:uncharacterized membrane protein YjjP (DUF1212 family)
VTTENDAMSMTVPDEVDPFESFILALGRAIHEAGVPAYRLEEALTAVVGLFHREAQIFSTPTSLMVCFAPGRTTLLRVLPAPVELARVARLDALVRRIEKGTLSLDDAPAALAAIVAAPPAFRRSLVVLAHGMAASSSAVFFGGSLADVVVAFVIGCLVGFLAIPLGREASRARAYDLIAALVSSLLAQGAAFVVGERLGGVSAPIATLAGLVVLLPGLMLTTAMTELATRHLVSGTARLMAAVITFLELGLGVAVGERLFALVVTSAPTISHVPLPTTIVPFALIAIAVSAIALFQSEWKTLLGVLAACAFAFVGARGGAFLFGPELGVFVGALAVASFANAVARVTDTPATVTLVPAILLLVPGSLGYRSLASLVDKDTLTGVETGIGMLFVAISIVAGLLVANALVAPRRML